MSDPITPAVERFWAFWTENRSSIERSIDEGDLRKWVEAIGVHVKAIDAGLDWEMGKGLRAQHYFCVAAKGDLTKRIIAERWHSLGPAADAVFEYHTARPGGGYDPGQEIAFGEQTFGADAFRFSMELAAPRRRVHIEVWHPMFARVDRELAGTATFIMLDNVFGEDDVERWIGAVDLVDTEPSGAGTFTELMNVVDELRASDETFSLLQGQLPDGAPVVVTANLGLKKVDHLLMDLHLEITVTLRGPTDHGLTTNEEADALNASEDVLTESLGHDAVYIGRETRQGERVLHFHAANGGPALARIDAWVDRHPWSVEVAATLDPEWEILRRW